MLLSNIITFLIIELSLYCICSRQPFAIVVIAYELQCICIMINDVDEIPLSKLQANY